MKIRLAEKSDYSRWNKFVMDHNHGTIFHLIAWKEVLERSFGHRSFYLLAEEKNNTSSKILGIFPLFQVKSFLFGNCLVSLPFAELGGILAQKKDVESELLLYAINLAKELRVDYLEMRNKYPIQTFPTKDLYFNFRREIFPEPEENLKAIPRKSRRMVRVGIKAGLQAEFGTDQLSTFYELLARNYHRLGTPIFNIKYFKNLIKILDKNIDILIVKTKEGHPIAGVMTFYFKDQVIPYYAGSNLKFRNLAPNDFMYWKLMEKGCQEGYKWFDFGRSKKDTGSFRFKKHWGFEPEQLAYQYVLNKVNEIPNISPANPKYRKRTDIWKKIPFWATKLIGPHIVKYIP